MTQTGETMATATEARYPLWAADVPFPAYDEMPDLDVVAHVAIERAVPGGYHYLHESAIAWHREALYVCWANHPLREVNVKDELKVRLFGGWGDGSRVGKPTEWSYPAAVEHDGKLYVSCTQGKEDCALSIIPVTALRR